MPAEEEPAPMEHRDQSDSPQQFCLKWNNYQSNLMSSFEQLLKNQSFVDVTLACDGQSLKAHKVVLSACSPYFETLFMDNPCRHPIIIMRDIKFVDLKAIVDFMYRGEINVSQEQLAALLKVAETLKVRGLTDVSEDYSVNPSGVEARAAKRRTSRDADSPARSRRRVSPEQSPGRSPRRSPHTPAGAIGAEALPPADNPAHPAIPPLHADDIDIRPGIAEMIREEERAKLKQNRAWLGSPLPSTSSLAADSYQYQLQSMYQNCWTTNQGLVHNLRFRERGPLKSWRPETMAEAIFSVLKEGLSLSQAARKYDIPYPTFVLYANRVHNMLGPSADGGADLRPKGRGRPQRILLGVWPDSTIRDVIRAVVFRDTHTPLAHRKDDVLPYPAITDGSGDSHPVCGNGRDEVPPSAATAAAVAAVAYGLRRQMCNIVGAAQRPQDHPHLGLPPLPLQSPCLFSPISEGLESPLCSPPPPGHALEPPRPTERFRPFAASSPVDVTDMGPPKVPVSLERPKNGKDGMSTPVSVNMESPPVESPDNIF